MGTEGNGSRLSAVHRGEMAQRSKQRAFAKQSALLSLLMIVIALWTSAAHAQTTNYVYDANGRVVAVTQNNGITAQYTYDTLGHLAQTITVGSGQLAILAFIPTHGEAGTQVTIEGQGFGASPASDSVTFNGTPATVVSTSATQIVTMVPAGATTGPISVSTGGNTAVSATPFVIDDTGLPPTISAISPTIVNAGATVTVTGTQLDPVANGTVVSAGGTIIQPTSVSASQIQLTATSSGYIGVQTPFGTATSPQPLIVLPSSIATTNVASSGYETPNGTPVTLNLGTTSQVGVLMVQAPTTGWVSIQASGISPTTSSISYTVYAPNGSQIVAGGMSTTSPSIHLPQLTTGGTYTVVFRSNTASTQITLALSLDTFLNLSTPTTVSTTVAYQSQRVLFNAEAGQALALAMTNLVTSPSGNQLNYTVYAPDGSQYTESGWTSGGAGANLSSLSLSGIYQLVLAPPAAVSFTTQVELFPGISGTQATNGTSQSYASSGYDQNISFSFVATQGQNLELTLSNLSTSVGGQNGQIDLDVYNAAGAYVAGGDCYTSSPASCSFSMWNLPAGVYTAIAQNSSGGTMSFQALIQPDVVGPSLTADTPVSPNLAAGQVERLTFNGTAGSNVALALTGMSTTPDGEWVYVSVYRPDVGQITTTNYYSKTTASGSVTSINLPSLPVSGTYTVIVSPRFGVPATAQLTFGSSPTATQGTSGTSTNYLVPVLGENQYFTFTATQGQNLELTLNQMASGANANVTINNAVGTNISGGGCTASTGCSFSMWNLEAGTYYVTVSPSTNTPLQFNAIITPDVIGPALSVGTPTTVNLGAGQVERLMFQGTVGGTAALELATLSTTPIDQAVYIRVYRPDVELIATGDAYASTNSVSGYSSSTINLNNLPATGTYTVVVYTTNGIPATATLTLAAGATGTQSTNGTNESYAPSLAGQNAYLSFLATPGQNLELSFNDIVNVAGGGTDEFNVSVNNVAGANVSTSGCLASNPGSSCILPLWNLPAGNYSVTLAPVNGNMMQFNASVQPDVVGPVLPVGTPESINIGQGQAERFTFHANAGDSVVLQTSALVTDPSGQTLCISVYQPDVGTITTLNPYSRTCSSTTTGSPISLPNLPAGGAYTVIATTTYGNPVTAGIELLSDAAGPPPTYGTATLPNSGVPQSEESSESGQAVTMTFNAAQGQNLELTLNNVVVTGASENQFSIAVNNAAGQNVSSSTCSESNSGSSCTMSLWNLAAGTYTAVATPTHGGVLQFTAMVQPDVVGPSLTVGTATNVTLAAGQVERLTFSGTAGQDLALELSNESTTPTGQSVYVSVYAPNVGLITPSGYSTQMHAASGIDTINLPNLPVTGTYTVVVSSSDALPATAQLFLANVAPGTQSTNGTAQSFAAIESGANVYLSFSATQGQNLELLISDLNVPANVGVYNSAGVEITSSTCSPSTSLPTCLYTLWNLPSGAYSVTVSPASGGQLQFNATIQPDVVGPNLVAGTASPINMQAGQVERFTFNGTVGQNVSLTLSNLATSPGGQPVLAYVYRPDTGPMTTSNDYTYQITTSSVETVNLENLPVTGTYTVIVLNQNYGLPITGQLMLSQDSVGALPTSGSGQSFSTTESGQDVYFSFTASQGQNLELSLIGANLVTVNVVNSRGVNIGSATCSPGCMLPLWNLPADSYSVIVTPVYDSTMQFDIAVQPDIVGPAITPSAPASINLSAGQAERLTFQGMLGEAINLQLSDLTITPAQTVYVYVYAPSGGLITPGGYYAQISAPGAPSVSLSNLPASGTYTAVVYAQDGSPFTAQLSEAVGGGMFNNSLEPFAASGPDLPVSLNFTAAAGQNLELTLNNINVVGASNNEFEVQVADPSGVPVLQFFCYAATPGSSCSQSLWNLTNGTYSVVAIPIAGGTISFEGLVTPDIQGPALTSGTPLDVSLSTGQVERVQFASTAGSTATLQLAGVNTTPANQNIYVYIYRPDVGVIETYNSYATLQADSSGSVTMSNLPVTGNYTAVITTGTGIPANAQLSYTTQ